ncbi:lipocalin-like domain-containing protein [Pelagovum pacificum]|uniref:Iron ABC transporter permease n=1 Tax=Pelagovum pacificum TaxID=2588711 RepID=A0A5C5GGU8_9RHOB|nr:lipocalin-like domain-containing protein [Pelagovum pacificum]QQA42944.1 iron ABC transporter permease [Pelagovum pacificum]TNY33913.1 iron ABC transporter permease [Pelagovum pacificum]
MNGKIALLCMLPVCASAQGFAGLGTEAEDFLSPERGTALTFPEDHGPHPGYRIEWWYVTANMTGPDGTPYGLQWTLFRSALSPDREDGWEASQLWMGHAALTTPDAHYSEERLSRGGIGTAGVTADPFEAWIDEWQLAGETFDEIGMTASGTDFAYDVDLVAQGPLVLHGDAGYSVKSAEGQASYYYSQPAYALEGTITLPDGEVEVTGEAWLDREWSSQPLSETQSGWDWFSLSFDDGERLMGFRLRDEAGGDYTSATWIGADGTPEAYRDGALTTEPLDDAEVEGRDIPVRWHLTLPDRGLDVTVGAINPQSWMHTSFAYWEGPVTVTGSHDGRGYLEMTGYE